MYLDKNEKLKSLKRSQNFNTIISYPQFLNYKIFYKYKFTLHKYYYLMKIYIYHM